MTLKKITAKITAPKTIDTKNLVQVYLGDSTLGISIKEIKKAFLNEYMKELLDGDVDCIRLNNFTFLNSIEQSDLSCGIYECHTFPQDIKRIQENKDFVELGFIILDRFIVPCYAPGVTYQMCFNQAQYDVFKPYIAKFKNFQLVKTFKNPNSRNMNYLFISKI